MYRRRTRYKNLLVEKDSAIVSSSLLGKQAQSSTAGAWGAPFVAPSSSTISLAMVGGELGEGAAGWRCVDGGDKCSSVAEEAPLSSVRGLPNICSSRFKIRCLALPEKLWGVGGDCASPALA